MTETLTIETTEQDRLIAWLAALAVCIHIVESALPSPFPGMKPGLANIITLAVLLRYNWTAAAWVSLLRVLIGSLLAGSFLTPTFLLSLSGAVASLTLLWICCHMPRRLGLGPVGLSLIMAMAHMSGQFTSAYVFIIPHPGLFRLLPVLMTMALVFGIMNGIVVHTIARQWQQR